LRVIVDGIYFLLGGQHTKYDENGKLVAVVEGEPGPIPNHNPAFYVDDAALKIGVRLHAYVAMDYLNGK
jgi:amidohydrolase